MALNVAILEVVTNVIDIQAVTGFSCEETFLIYGNLIQLCPDITILSQAKKGTSLLGDISIRFDTSYL